MFRLQNPTSQIQHEISVPKHRVSLECPFKKVWKIFCQNWSSYLAASCTALVTSAHGKPHSELSELRFAASLDITCSRNPKLQKSSNHGMFIQTSRLFTVKCNAIGKLQTSSLLFLFFLRLSSITAAMDLRHLWWLRIYIYIHSRRRDCESFAKWPKPKFQACCLLLHR